MTREALIDLIFSRRSYLCIGLDPDPARLPDHLRGTPDGIVTFCREIIGATTGLCVAYKVNIAFFEALGRRGWDILWQVREALPEEAFLIADAKRADIGNSSRMYAHAFFEEFRFDAVTVSPYMGEDSVRPFLDYPGKWTIVLALTSNSGAADFQLLTMQNGRPLFEEIIRNAQSWGDQGNLMFVTGATQLAYLSRIRELAPEHFLLVPGVGAQGGSLADVTRTGLTHDIGLLINSSREILYASAGEHFAMHAMQKARALQSEMARSLDVRGR